MKYFTIKDFILYNGPCFNCGKKVALSMHELDHNVSKYRKMPLHISGDMISVNIFPITLKIDISNNSYSTIWGANDINTYDPNYLSSYLKYRSLFFISSCLGKGCHTEIVSDDLVFDGKYVKPISIAYEKLCLTANEAIYVIESRISNNYGSLRVFDEKGRKEKDNIPIPPLLLGKLKNKENALRKIKKYLVFS